MKKIAATSADILGVERCGIWMLNEKNHRVLRCVEQYERSKDRHTSGTELSACDYPTYFKAMHDNRAIVADDAASEPLTKEFKDTYLKPLGITSMMDAPIRVGGKTVGVVCHEHVGRKRHWTPDEQTFAASIADLVSLGLDHQERRKAEAALREREQQIRILLDEKLRASHRKYRALTESIPDAILVATPDAKIDYANPAAERLFGRSLAELEHGSVSSLFPPDQFQRLRESCQSQPRSDAKQILYSPGLELEGIHSSGKRVPVDVKVCHYRASGEPQCLFIIRDITEKKKAEDAIRESQEQFQALFEQAGVGIAQVGFDGRFLKVNQKLCDILGYGKEELQDKRSPDITHPEDLSLTLDTFRDFGEGRRETLTFEKRFIHKNGSGVWVQVDAVSVPDNSGKPHHAIGVIQDITERKKTEQQLQLLASITSASAEGITVLDGNQRVLFWNEAAERIHGFTSDEVLGKNARELFVPKGKEKEFEKLFALRPGDSGETVVGLRTERLHKSGRRIPVSLTSFTIQGGSDSKRKRVVIFQDMTREVEMQERLMEQSNMAAIGEMAANIVHEIRNPLFAISSVAQALARETGTSSGTRELADSMFSEISRLNQLLESVLLFAKPARLEVKPANPKLLFEELVEFHRADQNEKSIRLEVDFDPSDTLIPIDPSQMKQVLRNLYLNAIQASFPGGILRVRSRVIPGQQWLFEIQNGGEPIDPKKITLVFKPFFSTKKDGVGLGLSISKRIVEAHGGTIHCVSKATEGTKFCFELPLESALTGLGD